jgi:molybdate transport system substrate-binding protein
VRFVSPSSSGRRLIGFLLVLGLIMALGAGAAAAKSSKAGKSDLISGINVFAAASLTDVLPAMDKSPTYSFGSSGTLATQITNGAPADVFLSANTTNPATLYAAGRVDKPVNFTRNKLVIVVPKSNPAGITSIYDLANPGTKIVVAATSVPVGTYTLQVLKQMNLTSRVQPNFVSQETDVRAVLSKIQLGQGDAGFVYSTDAQTVPNDVKVIKVPAWAQPKVVYAMAVVSNSPNKAKAQAFLKEVLSKAGQKVFAKYGFLPLTSSSGASY